MRRGIFIVPSIRPSDVTIYDDSDDGGWYLLNINDKGLHLSTSIGGKKYDCTSGGKLQITGVDAIE